MLKSTSETSLSSKINVLLDVKTEEKLRENRVKFYGIGSKIIIEGFEIEDPLLYIGDGKSLDFAIDKTDIVEFSNNFVSDNSNNMKIDINYGDLENNYRYLFLKWLAEGKENKNIPSIFLILYFRNLQHRAVAEEKDQKVILFELLNIYKKYKNIFYNHFEKDILNLIKFLIFKINSEEFTENDEEQLLNFIESVSIESEDINYYYNSLFIKIKNIDPSDYIKQKYNPDNFDTCVKNIFDFIKNKDYTQSSSKFYSFNRNLFNKKYKGNFILLLAFKAKIYDNNINLSNPEDTIIVDINNNEEYYNNYYLPTKYKSCYSYYSLEENVGLKTKKAIYEAAKSIEEYENIKKTIKKDKNKKLSRQEKFDILPEKFRIYLKEDTKEEIKEEKKIKKRINYRISPKLKLETINKKDVNIKNDFNIDSDKLLNIRNETKQVKEILTKIFIDERTNKNQLFQKTYNIKEEKLDEKIEEFVKFLLTKKNWQKKELMEYCKEKRLMLYDAISIINDYYDEKFGEYLIEEDEDYIVNNILSI
jgi:hypothetical protein